MNWLQRITLLLSLTLLGACPAPKPGSPQLAHNCPGANPGIVPININYNGANITVAPDPQTADEGDVLRFNLVGGNGVLVSTSGKTAEAGWLNGHGKKKAGKAESEHFFVCVPTDLFEGEDEDIQDKSFGYNVDAVGKPQLDPIVIINKL